jgi:hypothetical protein
MGRRSRGRADAFGDRSRDDSPGPRQTRRERAKNRPKRQKRDWEAPGAILGGPPISLTCECGIKHDLQYGEAWTCESCGRRWDTRQIPREQYEAVRRTQLRFRVLPVALGLVVLGLAIFFTLSGNIFSVFFLLPVGLTFWFVFLRPFHRRRYRAAIADLPRWELHPE